VSTACINSTALTPAQQARIAARCIPRLSDWSEVSLPALPDVPGMISHTERRFLYWLTSQGYAGVGAVVEVGTWLGRSSIHLAAGLRDAGFHEALWCYDRFIWDAPHRRKAPLQLEQGESFQPQFEANVRPVYPLVRVAAGDLKDITWTGGPIELLVLDAPKRLPEISAALSIFGPHLIPGVSLLVLQDFLHAPSYDLPTVIGSLTGVLAPVHALQRSGTVTFGLKDAMNVSGAQPIAWNGRRWSEAQARAAWQNLVRWLPGEAGARLAPGLAFLLHDLGATEAAQAELSRLPMDDRAEARWRHYAESSLYERYRPLFQCIGIRPSIGKRLQLATQGLRRRRKRLRQVIGRRVQRVRGAGTWLLRRLGVPA
jgi:hypothetical protein